MIGILIQEKLKIDAPLNSLIDGKIFPLTVPDKVEIPHIAYGVKYLRPDYVKVGISDGISVIDNVEIEFDISSSSYKEIQLIVSALRLAIEGKKLSFNRVTTQNIMLQSVDESFDYKSRNFKGFLTFDLKTNRM